MHSASCGEQGVQRREGRALTAPGNSRQVGSAQEGPHRDLETLLTRHAAHPFRKPYADYNLGAYAEAKAAWGGAAPLILDAGCGVGWSTLAIARECPDHFVLGVDQSRDRLERGKPAASPANVFFVRADLVDFWRLLAADGVRLARHYLLYPNPWPKIGQVARRWPGHAVFPTVVALGGILECRSNWRIYVEELAFAVERLTGVCAPVEPWQPALPLTPFERKYLESGHALWRWRGQLDRGLTLTE